MQVSQCTFTILPWQDLHSQCWHTAGRSGPHPRELCSPSEGLWQDGGVGREELSEVQQGKMHLGKDNPKCTSTGWGSTCWKTALWKRIWMSCRQQAVRDPAVPWCPGRPKVSWCVLGRALQEVGGGSCPSAQPWWGTPGVLCAALGSSAQERHEAPGAGPVESSENDEGSGAFPLQGKAERVGPVHSRRDGLEGTSAQHENLWRDGVKRIDPRPSLVVPSKRTRSTTWCTGRSTWTWGRILLCPWLPTGTDCPGRVLRLPHWR